MDFSKFSAVLIVKNGGATLLECLNSLKSFDEIILLENGSSDDTLEIAYKFKENFPNLRIEQSEFIGFGALKNLALSYARNEWVFNIDADEVLESLCLEELATLKLDKEHILALPRKNLYKKEWIKACGWYPDFVLRIFNKNFTHFNDNAVHESLILPKETKIIKLKSGIKHIPPIDIEKIIYKMNLYTSLSAKEKFAQGKKASILGAIFRFFFVFFKDYILRLGFRYGYKGFIIALLNANGAFFRYMKLYELQNEKN